MKAQEKLFALLQNSFIWQEDTWLVDLESHILIYFPVSGLCLDGGSR